MNTGFAIVEGNLALSTDAVFEVPAPRTYRTRIYELPARPACAVPSAVPEPRSRLSASCSAAVVVALLIALIGAAWFMLSSANRAYSEAAASTERQAIVVEPGESLWSLADEYGIDGLSTRETSDIIRSWNGLDSSTLQPGDTLLVPAHTA